MRILRMVTSHAGMLDQDPQYRATVVPIAGGVRMTVTARGDAMAHMHWSG